MTHDVWNLGMEMRYFHMTGKLRDVPPVAIPTEAAWVTAGPAVQLLFLEVSILI